MDDFEPVNFSTLLESAIALHELFQNLVDAGFNEVQALTLVGQVLLRPQEK